MSLQWEPQWEEVVVESHGIRLKVKRDRETGLYACPICGSGSDATYLFTVEDLVRHIAAHALSREAMRRERISVSTEREVGEAAKLEETGEEE